MQEGEMQCSSGIYRDCPERCALGFGRVVLGYTATCTGGDPRLGHQRQFYHLVATTKVAIPYFLITCPPPPSPSPPPPIAGAKKSLLERNVNGGGDVREYHLERKRLKGGGRGRFLKEGN